MLTNSENHGRDIFELVRIVQMKKLRIKNLPTMYVKLLLLVFALNTITSISAQSTPDEIAIKALIEQLFDGMNKADSTIIKPLFINNAIISSIFKDQEGNTVKRSNLATSFVTTAGTARDKVWNETVWSYKFHVDEPMAYVWTEYSFFLDDALSHCGVNMFEMLKVKDTWRISSITDTRRTTNCYTQDNISVHRLLDAWHKAAAIADENIFFGLMAEDAVYIGTDPTERWTRGQMISLLGKYFERETAWSFSPLSRQVEVDTEKGIAWFDELLDTWMGTCRGSGVLRKNGNNWQIVHYHLAISVPNDKVNNYLELIGKAPRKE